jgi:hypothetical protein
MARSLRSLDGRWRTGWLTEKEKIDPRITQIFLVTFLCVFCDLCGRFLGGLLASGDGRTLARRAIAHRILPLGLIEWGGSSL